MYFNQRARRLALGFLISTALAFATGCGLRINDKKKSQNVFEIPTRNVECIRQMGRELTKYWNMELDQEATSAFFNCVQESLRFFLVHTEGDDRGSYSTEEIYLFLKDNFIKDRPLTSRFASEIMQLKAGVFGGSPTRVTKAEFQSFIALVGKIGELARDVQPHLFVFKQDSPDAVRPTREQFTLAFDKLSSGLRAIGVMVSGPSHSYDLNHVGPLIEELRKFLFFRENELQSHYAQKAMDLGKAFHQVAVRSGATTIMSGDLGLFLEQSARVFKIYINGKYLFEPLAFFTGQEQQLFFDLFEDFFVLLERAIQNGSIGYLRFEDFDQVFSLLDRMQLLPFYLHGDSLRTVFRHFVLKVLKPTNDFYSTDQQPGIGLEQVTRLRQELQLYRAQYQKLLEFRRADGSLDVVALLSSVSRTPNFGGPPDIRERAFEYLLSTPPIFKSGDFQPQFDRAFHTRHQNHNFFDASLKGFFFIGVRLMAYGYSTDFQRATELQGVNDREMESFFNDFRPVLQDIRMLHPQALGVGPRLFFEGNAFTFSATGYIPSTLTEEENNPKRFLDPHEGLELISLLVSNFFVGRRIYDDMLAVCPTGGRDFFGLPRIQRTCFARRFKEFLQRRWTTAPAFQTYLRTARTNQWNQFAELLFESVKDWDDQTPSGPQYVQSTAVATMTMIIHYIESILVQFDEDQNQRISTREARKAFPRFRYMLKDISQKMCRKVSDKDLESVFLYILKKRKAPDDLAWVEIVRGSIFGWGIDEDRLSLLETFTLIVRLGREASSAPPCN